MSAPGTSTSKTEPTADDLRSEIEALQADLAKITETVTDNLAEGIGNAGRKIGQAGRDARASAANVVHEHPLAAVGIAAGLGFLTGMTGMLTRKR